LNRSFDFALWHLCEYTPTQTPQIAVRARQPEASRIASAAREFTEVLRQQNGVRATWLVKRGWRRSQPSGRRAVARRL
jgi:hypothetical protein